MGRIVVASNRGPVSFSEDGTAGRGGGGLAPALGAAMANSPNTWVAAAMGEGDRAFAARSPGRAQVASTDMGDFRLRLVAVAPGSFEEYYDTVANRLLWFTLHGLFDPVRRPLLDRHAYEAWDHFVDVNRAFAGACCDEAGPGDRLLAQDYHLPLVPRLVREATEGIRIAHFTHTAWPRPQAFDHLPSPWVEDIVHGMLGADLVGFHSRRWASSFVEVAAEYAGANPVEGGLEVEGRRVQVGVFPLGPDPAALAESAASEAAAEAGRQLDELVGGRRLVLRVERLEPAKNALRGLVAFERLLDDDPSRAGSVVHLVLSYPSRKHVPEYAEYLTQVQEYAARIESRYPGTVVLLTDDDYPRSLAALARFDVLIVNSIADGLNLVAKEGAILNRHDGTLVLSRDMGAVEQLGPAAFVVNPYDTTATAEALRAALDASPEERGRRAEVARAGALACSPTTWLEGQLRALDG